MAGAQAFYNWTSQSLLEVQPPRPWIECALMIFHALARFVIDFFKSTGPSESVAVFDQAEAEKVNRCNHHWEAFQSMGGKVRGASCAYCFEVRLS